MNHIGRDVKFTVGSFDYTISRFTRGVLNSFLEWADKILPHPLDALKGKLEGFPKDIQEMLVRDAIDSTRLRRSVTNPEVNRLMNSEQGAFKILHLLLAKHHPDLSEDDVWDIYMECAREHGDEFLLKKIAQAQGELEVADTGTEDGAEKKG